MSDLLRMDYINKLPQPLWMREYGGLHGEWWWPINDIEVQTGLLRIDVCGKLQVKHIGDVRWFRDANGNLHDPETFFSDHVDDSERAKEAK